MLAPQTARRITLNVRLPLYPSPPPHPSPNISYSLPIGLNIEVTGSGTETPAGVVGTQLYTASEDGIIFNPYAATIDYNIPGPQLWTGGSTGGSTTTSSTPTVSAAPSASGNATTPVTVAPSATATPTATATPDATEPESSAVPAPSASAESGSGAGDLPEEFTVETFIAWLEGKVGGSTGEKVRRHARAFF